MPYKRYLVAEPPGEAQMNGWEAEGWSSIQVLGPCAAMDTNTKKPKVIYIVYLWRSIVSIGQPIRAS